MNLDPAISRQECFHPPYCPNSECEAHPLNSSVQRKFYHQNGWQKTQVYPFRVKQYRCKLCRRAFGYTNFKLSFRQQRYGLNSKIFALFTCGISNCEIARRLSCSEHLVRMRLKKLSQWAIIRHAQLTADLKIDEPIVFDGLENFSESQYNPNNINQAIGKRSYFIYDWNYAPMNRKGRMSPRQHGINLSLEKEKGRYDTRAIRKSAAEIFKRLNQRQNASKGPLVIYSDEHFQYRRALKRDLKDLNITHITTSSKDTRNYQNNLFAVNHLDLIIRQHVGAFSRETICFSKTPQRMIGKYSLFTAFKNYMRTVFVKKQKRRPESNVRTPAMELGIASKKMAFHEFFDIKRLPTQISLHREFQAFYDEKLTYQRQFAC